MTVSRSIPLRSWWVSSWRRWWTRKHSKVRRMARRIVEVWFRWQVRHHLTTKLVTMVQTQDRASRVSRCVLEGTTGSGGSWWPNRKFRRGRAVVPCLPRPWSPSPIVLAWQSYTLSSSLLVCLDAIGQMSTALYPLASLAQIEKTPSREDGIPEELELDLRAYGCKLIHEAGILLKQ